MNYYLERLADKLDSCLFLEDVSNGNFQLRAFMNYFDNNYSIPLTFLNYLKKEIQFSLMLNAALSTTFSILIPYYFSYFWEYSQALTLWIAVLSLFNWIIVWPKLILLSRIKKVTAVENSYTCGYLIWSLFRSKVYRFNNRISKYIFCTYVAGMGIIWFCKYSLLFWSCASLLIFFIIRLLMSFYKFNNTFANYQNVDMLFEYLEGNTADKISSLKVIEYKDLQSDPKLRDQKSCPICYECYAEEAGGEGKTEGKTEGETEGDGERGCLLKMMECPGQHIFHQKCIDCWLLKSEKCPMCNCSVYHQRDSENSKLNKGKND
jgi:hypothetical protein